MWRKAAHFLRGRSATFWWAVGLAVLAVWALLPPSPNAQPTFEGRLLDTIVAVPIFASIPYIVSFAFKGAIRLAHAAGLGRAKSSMREPRERGSASPRIGDVSDSPARASRVSNRDSGPDNVGAIHSTSQASSQSPVWDPENRGSALTLQDLHPRVREESEDLWQSGHYAYAVAEAAKAVNAELQRKLGRFDVSESALVGEAFSPKEPEKGAARLRPPGSRGTPSWRSRLEGTFAFGRGCYMAIRNPIAHSSAPIDRVTALHHLAAFSLLATWIDEFEVEYFGN